MDTTLLDTKFARIGARLHVADLAAGPVAARTTLNVLADRRGEFFTITRPPAADVSVLDVRPADRHLLLLVREGGAKHKFLCGHDERHWFVAAVPEAAPVGTVRQAKEALKPAAVRAAQAAKGLRAAAQGRRKTAAYVRQGEWFFVPEPGLAADPALVLRHEPLRRGGGKPHCAEFCYRTGGETVYVCRHRPNGVTEDEYRRLLATRPAARTWGWRPMRRNAEVFVRGRIRHADHRTVTLHGWHRVLLNTESQAAAMRHVAFLD